MENGFPGRSEAESFLTREGFFGEVALGDDFETLVRVDDLAHSGDYEDFVIVNDDFLVLRLLDLEGVFDGFGEYSSESSSR